ncbi:TPA: IS66 family transposase [Legionella pneumophila subsp. pneumophila]|nr:IS66 family transposase [Legionella pneumophila subsp. pneumophila]
MSIELPETIEDCHELIKRLVEITDTLVVRIEKLEQENRALKERLNNNSSNSSKPPSQYFKKKKAKKPNPNKGGGVKGHQGHFRKLLNPEEVDEVVSCNLPKTCFCGGQITVREEVLRHQVHELPRIKLHVTEYQLEKGACNCCGKKQIASLPEGITWGITGPRLTSLMSHMLSRYKLSRRELQTFLAEHYAFKMSMGCIYAKQRIVAQALEEPVKDLFEQVKLSSSAHMDETGHRRDGLNQWLWGMISEKAAFFSVEPSRGKKVIARFMEDFNGFIISDRYAAYNFFESSKRQICWAHLKRDFTRLSEKQDKLIARIGKDLLECQMKLFEFWHQFKLKNLSREELIRKTRPLRHKIGELLEQGTYTDPKLKIVRFCSNLLTHFTALWTFIFNENIEPTNNHAEQSLRPVVIWRKKYFGTHSDYGSDFVARTMSLITSCRLQAISTFEVFSQILTSYFAGQKSLIFANPT